MATYIHTAVVAKAVRPDRVSNLILILGARLDKRLQLPYALHAPPVEQRSRQDDDVHDLVRCPDVVKCAGVGLLRPSCRIRKRRKHERLRAQQRSARGLNRTERKEAQSRLYASPRKEVLVAPRGLLPQTMTQRVTNTTELIDAVKNASVGTIIVAAGTYKLTSKMSITACGHDDGDSALCIGRDLTIRAETNGTVVLDAMKQTWRVIYVDEGRRAELVGLNITGGKTDHDVRWRFEPAA